MIMNIRKKLEYPYLKYLQWKYHYKTHKEIKRGKLINIKYSISASNLLLFYLIGLCVITISLAVFIALFLIIKDIIS